MAKKRQKVEMPQSSWIDTYADTVTLLLTFFVLLYSISSVDAQKLKQISNALNQVLTGEANDSILQFELYDGDVPLVGGESEDESIDEEGETIKEENQTYEEVKSFVMANGLDSVVTIISDNRGVIIQLKDSILFETGEANLKDESLQVLDKINTLVSTMPNNIIIEGHTDNVPIKTMQFPSNWELSGARASRVLRYFTEEKEQDGSRFLSQGCGEVKPLVANDSDENRAINRRVNILIVANNNKE